MRIAYLTTQYPALSHSFIRREIAALEALGHDVLRFSIRAAGASVAAADQAEQARTRFILPSGAGALFWAAFSVLIGSPRRWGHGLRLAWGMARLSNRGLIAHLAYFAEACWLRRALRDTGVVHLHAHFGTNPAAVARLLRALGGPPYSFTVHGPDEFDRPAALDLRGKAADAAFVVAISDFGRAQLMRWTRLADWPRLAVVRCGVDDSFQQVPDRSPAAEPVLVAVARLAEQKGLPLLVEAAAQLHAAGHRFRLRVVGDGPLRDELAQRIAAAGLDGVVTLVGPLDGAGVAAEMLAARAFVLPSFAEGLPVVVMEALALRRPVIATAIAGTPELVDAGCGWLVPAGAVAPLASAMADALEAPPARLRALGEEGRRRVLARHDALANARRLAGLIAGAA